MMRVRFLMLGKTRRGELAAVLDEYVKRIGRSCAVEVNEARDGAAAIKKLDADRAATAVLLDAGGKTYDSEAFAKWLGEQRDRGTRETSVCDFERKPVSEVENGKQRIPQGLKAPLW